MTGAFEAAILTGSAALRPISGNGHRPEHVMAQEDWAKINDPSGWSGYLEDRLVSIVKIHKARSLVIAADLTAEDGRIDRNLYACLLPLGLAGRQDGGTVK